MMKKILLFAIGLICVSCGNGYGNEIAGQWRTPDHEMSLSSVRFTFTVYSFHTNGSVDKTTYGKSIRFDPKPSKIISDQFHYKLVGDKLTIGDETWSISINGDRMQRIRDGEKLQTLERIRE